MSKIEIKVSIIDMADKIAEIVSRGNDVEIRKDASGIKVLEIKKAVVR